MTGRDSHDLANKLFFFLCLVRRPNLRGFLAGPGLANNRRVFGCFVRRGIPPQARKEVAASLERACEPGQANNRRVFGCFVRPGADAAGRGAIAAGWGHSASCPGQIRPKGCYLPKNKIWQIAIDRMTKIGNKDKTKPACYHDGRIRQH